MSADDSAQKVPLIEQLRTIHPDTRVELERGPSESSSVPIGYLAHAAADQLASLRAAIEAARERISELEAFVNGIMDASGWPETPGDLDGGDLQDIAVKHGVLIATYPTEPCGEHCACAEAWHDDDFKTGRVVCYHRAASLAQLDALDK